MTNREQIAKAISILDHVNRDFAPPWWGKWADQPPDTILLLDADKERFRALADIAIEAMTVKPNE